MGCKLSVTASTRRIRTKQSKNLPTSSNNKGVNDSDDVTHSLDSNTSTITTTSSETNDEYRRNTDIVDDDEFIEVTTECDDDWIQTLLLNLRRSKPSYSKYSRFAPFTMMDEMSTDGNCCDDIPNMDDPPVPCTILTIRRKHVKSLRQPTETDSSTGEEEDASESSILTDPSSNEYHHHRMLAAHKEQQKKLLSLMTNLLPWTHAIVLRKQRQVQVRQTMISSLFWFSMFIWPTTATTMMQSPNQKKRRSTRHRNPTTLFRR
jgi:hypothetical protein